MLAICFYHDEVCCFYCELLWGFYHEQMLNFVKGRFYLFDIKGEAGGGEERRGVDTVKVHGIPEL